MTEPTDEPTLREKDPDAKTPTSTGVMFTTILLLIGGLLLSSIMLLHYGQKNTDENGKPISGLTRFVGMTKISSEKKPLDPKTQPPSPQSLSAVPSTNTQDTVVKSSGFNLKNLFSRNSSSSVRWPRLKLVGFGLPSDGELGFAIINGKHVIEGSTINGVTLKDILAHGVLVEYKGETKTLIVEMTD